MGKAGEIRKRREGEVVGVLVGHSGGKPYPEGVVDKITEPGMACCICLGGCEALCRRFFPEVR